MWVIEPLRHEPVCWEHYMGQIRTYLSHLLILALIVALLAGCGPQATPESAGDGPSYSGALDTTAEGALDATTQLALGTLRLEDTPDAVTQEQAASLLPLWQALQGSALKGAAEQHAVLRQIEDTMDEAQVSAIAAMRLTQDDVQAWAQSQGPGSQGAGSQGAGSQGPGNQEPGTQGGGGQRFGGQAGQGGARPGMTEEQIAQMRQQFENMSPEERATRRAQFAGPGGPAGQGRTGGRAASSGLIGGPDERSHARAG
jgi:hypothetical protein